MSRYVTLYPRVTLFHSGQSAQDTQIMALSPTVFVDDTIGGPPDIDSFDTTMMSLTPETFVPGDTITLD